MPLAVGVSFRKAGEVYYYDPGRLNLHDGDLVIAEGEHGFQIGEVAGEPKWMEQAEVSQPLRRIIRLATAEDLKIKEENEIYEQEAIKICKKQIEESNLPMDLVECELTFDRSKFVFYFTSEQRVDFRELIRNLSKTLGKRVEFYKIGVRDEAKRYGGVGPCGREVCCASFLTTFESVSIKMAREQGLSINPLKISGLCGRLMCCLKFEYDIYKELKEKLPPVGSEVQTYAGTGKIIEVNLLRELVVVEIPNVGKLRFPAEDVTVISRAAAVE